MDEATSPNGYDDDWSELQQLVDFCRKKAHGG